LKFQNFFSIFYRLLENSKNLMVLQYAFLKILITWINQENQEHTILEYAFDNYQETQEIVFFNQ
jgi:hypothetical protein